MRDTRQFETLLIIQLLGIIGAAFLLDTSGAMWIAICGAFFVLVVAMANTNVDVEEKHSALAPWAEAATLIVLCVVASKQADLWAMIGIRLGGLLITLASIGKRQRLNF